MSQSELPSNTSAGTEDPREVNREPGAHREDPPVGAPLFGASFGQAVVRFWKGYVAFAGRASRSEFLWASLFLFLVGLLLAGLVVVTAITTTDASGLAGPPYFVCLGLLVAFYLAIVLPQLALAARRLSDTGSSPLLLLLAFIPWVGSLVVFILCCRPSIPTLTGAHG